MSADDLLQLVAGAIDQAPLSAVRDEADYPDLGNPLHLAILLIDCDTEVDMNGVLGFLENPTGRHLDKTARALAMIGAPRCAALLDSVQLAMRKHGVTWAQLRDDFEAPVESQVTSFHQLHGSGLDAFADEVGELASGFSLFNPAHAPEDAYGALCRYLDERLDELAARIEARTS